MRRRARFVSIAVLLLLLSWTGKPVQAGKGAAQNPAKDNPAAQYSAPQGVLARVYYADRSDLQEMAARLDVWEVHPEAGYLLALLTPAEQQELLRAGFRVVVDETRTAILDTPRQVSPGQTSGIFGFACYRTITETYASAQAIVLARPNLASWASIGPTWEKANLPQPAGTDLYVLRLTNSAVPGPKPRLFVMASIHAREYAPAELLTRFAETLVSQYGINPDVTWLLDYREILLLLQANPDGRKQAEAGQLWRKNTDRNYCPSDPYSRGADLNRNFPYQWIGLGSSGLECDETYRGASAGSETETQDILSFVNAQFPDQRPDDLTSPAPADTPGLFLDLHSYGNLVLWPWGWTGAPAPNADALQTLGRKFAFINGSFPEQSVDLYATNGTTDDYAYGALGVAAYTFEMGTDFFQDCPTFENTILPDYLPALLYAAKAAGRPYLEPSGPDVVSLSTSPQAALPGEPVRLQAVIDGSRYSTADGAEPTYTVNAAVYTVDTPPWITATVPITHSLAALDGTFDQVSETVAVTLDTTALSLGRHIIYVHGMNSHGAWGLVSAAFLDITHKTYLPDVAKHIP
jgi:carboxypeptidase T